MAHQIKPHKKEVADLLKKTFTSPIRNPTVEIDGCTLPQNIMMDEIDNFEVFDDDVWVCSFPKSGTTWTVETVWCIANDCDFEGAKRSIHERFPHIEVSSIFNFDEISRQPDTGFTFSTMFSDSLNFTRNLSRPRFIRTHLPYHLLPRQIRTGEKKPKIICVARNPKDNCISYFHQCTSIEGFTGTLDEFTTLFLENAVLFAPFWKHVQGYWEKRNDDNLLYFTFENMKQDFPSVLRKIGKFLNKDLTDDQVSSLLEHLNFKTLKTNSAVNNEDTVEVFRKLYKRQDTSSFIRNGTTGQWKTVMTPEMNQQFDDWIRENSNGVQMSY
ncbi:luciferin sulfotransferase-like [Athalia rosae]|uniref:luciferin sulfotransferase-like n=1 Tax=Athalia rosae TaxID=37344 RepID=UPI0020334FB0|nr:luciferin sulfotransferase-like [Athalia rosae]